MSSHEMIIAGFGGQGVLVMGQILVYAGMREDKHVTWLPSYGPEMRGGTTNCSVIISEGEIYVPVVSEADSVITMNTPSLEKYGKNVVKGGGLFVNSSIVTAKIARNDIKAYYVPCSNIALGLGNAKVANVVMMGAFLAVNPILKIDGVIDELREYFGEHKKHLVDINIRALAAGAEYISKT